MKECNYRNCTNCGKKFRVVLTFDSVVYCSYECAEKHAKKSEKKN